MRGLRRLALVLGLVAAAGAPGLAAEPTPAERAERLTEQARQLYGAGRHEEAIQLLRQALEIRQKLYPAERFPDGHRDLATSHNNLGLVLRAHGDLDGALPHLRAALAQYEKLYPAERFPDG